MASRTSYLIKNGLVVNGLGEKPYEADVLVVDDKIKEIGKVKENSDHKLIDAKNMLVCPGFIDINNHSDSFWTFFEYPNQESLLTQGISSIIGGNCGSSIAPIIGEGAIDSIRKYVDIRKVHVHWSSYAEFMDFLQERKLALNFGSLVGHSTIRRSVIGESFRQLNKEELKVLCYLLEVSMQNGAFGLSTGLVYSHARVASREEILSLAKIVKENNGLYATHLRQEGDDLIASVKEALNIANTTGVNLQISHLKAAGKKSWHLQEEVLKLIEEARENGINVNYDVYPYIETGPVLYTLLPAWSVEGGKLALINRLKDPAIRYKIIQEMLESDFDYGEIVIATSKLSLALPRYKVREISKNQGKSNEEVVIDLILSTDDTITIILESLSTKNVEKAIAGDFSIIATNGAGYSLDHQKQGDLVHPRCFGTMPRFLRNYAIFDKVLTIEKAILKITSLPAKKCGIFDEVGSLEEGKKADIVIIDPDKLKDCSTVKNPYKYSKGVKELFINGKLVILDYELDNIRAGRVLRKV
jgi:N-acyl-D-amino-acid deacylase